MKPQRQYSLIALSYGEALFRSAKAQGILQRVSEEAKALIAVIKKSRQRLRIFLGNPQIANDVKFDVLNKALGTRFSPVTLRLIRLLVERERIGSLEEILDLYIEKVEQAEGVFHAEVQTAMELGFQEKLRLKTALEAYTGNKLRIDYDVDPALIGGVIFRFKDTLIDSSMQAGLEKIRQRMMNTSLARA